MLTKVIKTVTRSASRRMRTPSMTESLALPKTPTETKRHLREASSSRQLQKPLIWLEDFRVWVSSSSYLKSKRLMIQIGSRTEFLTPDRTTRGHHPAHESGCGVGPLTPPMLGQFVERAFALALEPCHYLGAGVLTVSRTSAQ